MFVWERGRRTLLLGLGALAAAGVHGQTSNRVRRVGWLGYTASDNAQGKSNYEAFLKRLRELGYRDGDNLIIEQRFAEGRTERYRDQAAELLGLGAELVVVGSGVAARAVMAHSRSVPIVTFAIPDPVKSGLIESFAHPGGQLTGLSNLANELVPKRVELLKAVLPAASRIGLARCRRCVIGAGDTVASVEAEWTRNAAAARMLGVALVAIDVDEPSYFESARALIEREHVDALVMGATPVNVALRDAWLELSKARRLPIIAPYRGFGAVFSYGPDYAAVMRRVAEYIARILDGAHPGDLPMEEPTRFEFVIDARQAKAMGLHIPQAALLRADEVVE